MDRPLRHRGRAPAGPIGRPPSRRALLGTGAAGLAAAALSACGSLNAGKSVNDEPTIPASSGKVTLTYWAWLKDLQKVCDVFNASQDRIEVNAVWIPGGDSGGYAKILSAVAAGGGPDIAQVELREVPEFALNGALIDLSRYGAADIESKFDPAGWAQVKVGDGIYAIPQDTGPTAFFYNRELLEQIGGETPATWSDYRDLAKEVADSEQGRYIEAFSVGDTSILSMLAMQAGAEWFKPEDDHWILNLTDDATMTMADHLDELLEAKLFQTAYGSFSTPWMSAAGSGQLLAYTGGSWADALIQSVPNAEGKWAVADMPRWDTGYASGMLGGSSAAILSTAQHPAEALEFLTWMCTTDEGVDSMIENCGIGWSPAKDYIGKVREEPSEFFSGENYNQDVILPMVQDQNLAWTWSPMTMRLNNLLSDGLRAAVNNGTKLADFFPDLQTQSLDVMRETGLNVEVAS